MLEHAPTREELRGADLRKLQALERRLNTTIDRVASLEGRLEALTIDPIRTGNNKNGKKKK